MAEKWTIELDGPSLAPIGFRARFCTPDSTSVFWTGELSEHGEVQYDGVARPTLEQVLAGEFPEIVGAIVLVLAVETPFSAIRSLVEDIRPALRTELKRLVEGAALSPTDPEPDIEQAVKNVRAATGLTADEKVDLFLQARASSDVVGVHPIVFAAVRDAEFPIPVLGVQELNLIAAGGRGGTARPLAVRTRMDGA